MSLRRTSSRRVRSSWSSRGRVSTSASTTAAARSTRSRTAARTTTARSARASGTTRCAASSARAMARPSISRQAGRSRSRPTSRSRRTRSRSSTARCGFVLSEPVRCWGASDPLYIAYHDDEWGRPVRDERGLYERLCLEGFQSGLSWLTILRKRENFRRAFADFDPEVVARFGERDVERLLADAGIVRHRGKIEATIANARGVLALREAGTSLDELVWSYRPEPASAPRTAQDWQAKTPESTALSKLLKQHGFAF